VAGATAGAVFLQSTISDGVTTAEWVQFLLAIAGAVGVFAVRGPVVQPVTRLGQPQV
jgi:hypothetical protein